MDSLSPVVVITKNCLSSQLFYTIITGVVATRIELSISLYVTDLRPKPANRLANLVDGSDLVSLKLHHSPRTPVFLLCLIIPLPTIPRDGFSKLLSLAKTSPPG